MVIDSAAWIRRFHPAPTAPVRLVCCPHAGGAASYFYPVSQSLAPEVEVLAVQYPGRQERRNEPPLTDAHQLADAITAALAPWDDRPLALFGHSLGATLAFEVARRLEAAGNAPLALFASGRRAPSRHREESVHLGDDEQLLAEIVKLEGTDPQMLRDRDVVRMILPAVRGDYRAAETYRGSPAATVGCPLYALTGDADPQVSEADARAWEQHTTGPAELRTFPGGHFYLNQHAGRVIALIRERLTALAGAESR